MSNIDTPFDSLSVINLEIFMSYAQDVYDRARLSNLLLDCSIQSKYLGRFLLAKLPGRMSWNGRVIPPTFSLMVMRKADRSCRSDEELESLR